MKKILLVDDESEVLMALSRMFPETDYEIFTAESGMDALSLIEANHIDMVISDMHMPVLDGYKLLSVIKEKYPKIIRIILSGYAEEKPMFRALLHNVAKLYVFKPWNNNELLQNVDKLFSDEVVLNSDGLMKLIEDNCCSFDIPENCRKLISLIETEDLDGFVKELEQEPEISALLLEVVNSAVYGVMPKSIHKAASYIGLHNLKSFMHWACIMRTLEEAKAEGFEPGLLYQQAYLTNRIFLFFYETFLHKQPPEAAMFAGLMHNIGLILLIKNLQKSGAYTASGQSADEYFLELGDYMISHQEAGGHFLETWDLPFPMYEVALYHHRPGDPGIVNSELVSAVHIAQHYAWRALGAENLPAISEQVFEQLEVSQSDFEKRLARYLK